jgi:class 3 adenylate cyclase
MFARLSRLFDQMVERELHTFLFADIAGYSRIADERGDEAAADLALDFLERARNIAVAHGAEVVKCLGDAVMIHAEEAADAVQLALDLMDAFGPDAGLPEVHAGLHAGPALQRAGDWWGATVNVAARVAAAAEPGELLVTEAARLQAGRVNSARWRSLEPLSLKNIRLPVQVYAASRGPAPNSDRVVLQPLNPLPVSRAVTA